jgi:hypothetical protein
VQRGLKLFAFVLGIGVGATLASCGGDRGSSIGITPVGDTCEVEMHQNESGFEVSMTLACASGAVDCFTITSLSCNGVDKADELPLDLTGAADGCPGADYCIEDCEAGLERGSGLLWDTPSLLAVDGCNVYDDA